MKADFFIDRPVFSTVLSIIIVIVGGIGLALLPVDQYPQIVPPVVRISASYPGADAPALDPLPQAGYSSTGLTDETVHVVFAQVEKVADAQPEPAEFIEPFLLPIADVPRFLAENETPIGTRAQLVLEAFARRR